MPEGRIEVIACSPARRTRRTAEIPAGALGVPVEIHDDLREIDFGDWEGLTDTDVGQRWHLPAESPSTRWRGGYSGRSS